MCGELTLIYVLSISWGTLRWNSGRACTALFSHGPSYKSSIKAQCKKNYLKIKSTIRVCFYKLRALVCRRVSITSVRLATIQKGPLWVPGLATLSSYSTVCVAFQKGNRGSREHSICKLHKARLLFMSLRSLGKRHWHDVMSDRIVSFFMFFAFFASGIQWQIDVLMMCSLKTVIWLYIVALKNARK